MFKHKQSSRRQHGLIQNHLRDAFQPGQFVRRIGKDQVVLPMTDLQETHDILLDDVQVPDTPPGGGFPEEGRVEVRGRVDGLSYEQGGTHKGLLRRLFG